MSLWTAAEAAAATGGRAVGWTADGVSIDTREMAPGDLFVALTDRRDGHDFVADALARGAAAAMVSRVPEGVDPARLLVVGDVLAGLAALGVAGRARSAAQVAGITGSVGKTSAKEMLRAALPGLRVHAAERSFNNHWGVPLTLARMDPTAELAAVEIGMNAPGEIAPLSRLARPHVALVTTIAPAHLAAFGTLDGIASEKASICEGLEPEGVAVLPLDAPTFPILRAAAPRAVTFGEAEGADVRLLGAEVGADGTTARIAVAGREVALRLGVPGRHHLTNALGVLAVVHALGRDPYRSAAALADWSAPSGRGAREVLALPCGPVTLIDEAYNANPASLAAALGVLARAPGRRVAILGDMLELGTDAPALHAGLAGAASAADVVHTLGPLMEGLRDALPEGRRGLHAETPEALAEALPGTLERGDTVMVKGSKAIGASRVVDALRALGHGAGTPQIPPSAAREATDRCSTG
jgi:UDP-N-acetylmuramoyl-tripeptide--D-alanyl-D-alanine ligase